MLFTVASCFILGTLILGDVQADPDGKPGRCFTGTYLMEEGSGTMSLWTLTKDGNVLVPSSTQIVLNLSDLQGTWKKTGRREVTGTVLDFSFDTDGSPQNIARVDAVLRFIDQKCEDVEGEFSLRFFDPGEEDPLDPSTDTGETIVDTLEGRRVTVN